MRILLPKLRISQGFQLAQSPSCGIAGYINPCPRLRNTLRGHIMRGSISCSSATSSVLPQFSRSPRPSPLASLASRSAPTSVTPQLARPVVRSLQKRSTAAQPKAHWLAPHLAHCATTQASAAATNTDQGLSARSLQSTVLAVREGGFFMFNAGFPAHHRGLPCSKRS